MIQILGPFLSTFSPALASVLLQSFSKDEGNELELTFCCLVRLFILLKDDIDLSETFCPHLLACSTGLYIRLHFFPHDLCYGRAELEESGKRTSEGVHGEG